MATLNRSALMPELVSFNESGLPGFDVSSRAGLLAPANTQCHRSPPAH